MKNSLSIIMLLSLFLVHSCNKSTSKETAPEKMPVTIVLVHLLFLISVVIFAHYPAVFLWLLLFFIGFTTAYSKFQNFNFWG